MSPDTINGAIIMLRHIEKLTNAPATTIWQRMRMDDGKPVRDHVLEMAQVMNAVEPLLRKKES